VTAFRRSWALGSVGLAALALLGLRSDTGLSGSGGAQLALAPDCLSHYSTRCTIEIRYAHPAADLSVVPKVNMRKQRHAR
jgi:hypothetical protein